MKRLSLVLKACAVCSSLLLAGGYISYRSGLLNPVGPLEARSGLSTIDADLRRFDNESADLRMPLVKPHSSQPSLRDRVVMSGSESISVIVDESMPAALNFSSAADPVAVISFTEPSPADSNGQDNSDSEGVQRKSTSQESAVSDRKVVMFGSKSGGIDLAPSTLASIAQARSRLSGSLFIETVRTPYDNSDWAIETVLAAHREHPLDTIFTMGLINLPAFAFGFPLETIIGFITFRGIWAIFIHSNVRVPLGPLRMLLGSPDLHHWHHECSRDAGNYANISPLMDILFGTYRCPDHEPEQLGLPEPQSHNYLTYMIQPLLPAKRVGKSKDSAAEVAQPIPLDNALPEPLAA